jgi:hypothetical protein
MHATLRLILGGPDCTSLISLLLLSAAQQQGLDVTAGGHSAKNDEWKQTDIWPPVLHSAILCGLLDAAEVKSSICIIR